MKPRKVFNNKSAMLGGTKLDYNYEKNYNYNLGTIPSRDKKKVF